MNRIDIMKTIEQIDFGPETWEWLDLRGTIVGESQREAMIQEKGFRADTPYKKYLLCTINKDLQTINAIYFLLRCGRSTKQRRTFGYSAKVSSRPDTSRWIGKAVPHSSGTTWKSKPTRSPKPYWNGRVQRRTRNT